jgi:6-pyruvoyltetrahydropterin/6-carboxytetrahydropterin synthase
VDEAGRYELTVERIFRAAHAIVIQDEREASHEHDWRVRLTVAGPRLDGDGLLVDFHLLTRWLDEVLAPFRDGDLNRTPPFDAVNPTAEHVARHIAREMAARVPAPVRIERVAVMEAPGCEAVHVGGA